MAQPKVRGFYGHDDTDDAHARRGSRRLSGSVGPEKRWARNERGNYESHGWTITAETDSADSDVSIDDTPDFTFVRNYTMVFRGFFGLADKQATGRLWQDTIEKVLDGFDADPLLGGTANWPPPIAGRVRDQHREYGNYMVHYCELVLIVRLRRDRV